MRLRTVRTAAKPQILPSQDPVAAKRTLLSRLLPLIIFICIVSVIGIVIYYYNFIPRAIGRLQVSAVELGPKRPAFLERTFVSEGELVKKGQLLAELDMGELYAKRERAIRSVAEAKEALEAQRADLKLRQDELRLRVDDNLVFRVVDLESARVTLNEDIAKLESTKERLSGALIELDRTQKLVASSAVPQKQLDLQTAQVNALEKEVVWMEKAVASDKERCESSKQRMEQYIDREKLITVPIAELIRPTVAAIAVAEADLKLVEAQIEDSKLRSPLDGMVSSVAKREGSAMDIADPAITVVTPSKTLVEAYIQEEWVGELRKGRIIRLKPKSEGLLSSRKGRIVEIGSCVATIPLEFLESYEKFKYKGVRFIVELESEWNGTPGSRFDILF